MTAFEEDDLAHSMANSLYTVLRFVRLCCNHIHERLQMPRPCFAEDLL